MAFLGLSEDIPVLRGEFLYPGHEDPVPIVERYGEELGAAGMKFQYFKGNDSLLHYTLVDWSSGVRRMVDILERVKKQWKKRKHPGEWLYASFLGDFVVEWYTREGAGQQLDGSQLLELREVCLRLVYNGRAFLNRETFSLVSTCRGEGLLTGGSVDEHRLNLGIVLDGLVRSWHATSPIFGWVGIGERPFMDMQQGAGASPVPPNAWFVFYARNVVPRNVVPRLMQDNTPERSGLLFKELEDGGLLVENAENRPGEVGYL